MIPPCPPLAPAGPSAAVDADASLSALDRAILLTILYADLFDYTLTEDELYQQLVRPCATRASFEQALASLLGTYLTRSRGYVVWTGREELIQVRRRRRQVAQDLWKAAGRYAQWLTRVPFVRMVAVSGSLALENAEARSDIDLFCITEANRLWIARLCLVPLSKLTRRFSTAFPLYLCPNYILAADALEVADHNLFTAHEVTQTVPLWGSDAYRRFRAANGWARDFLPHCQGSDGPPSMNERPRPLLTRWCEYTLRGRLGDLLDGWVHHLFVAFYRRRAVRAGWPWDRLAPAYQRSRYTVPEGGYLRVVRRLFFQRVHERMGNRIPTAELEQLFAHPEEQAESCYDWAALFARDYGTWEREQGRGNGREGEGEKGGREGKR